MAKHLIIGSYVATGGCILSSNMTVYEPKNIINRCHWDLLKYNDYNKTATYVIFVLAPALVPVYTIVFPILLTLEYGHNKWDQVMKNNKENKENKTKMLD